VPIDSLVATATVKTNGEHCRILVRLGIEIYILLLHGWILSAAMFGVIVSWFNSFDLEFGSKRKTDSEKDDDNENQRGRLTSPWNNVLAPETNRLACSLDLAVELDGIRTSSHRVVRPLNISRSDILSLGNTTRIYSSFLNTVTNPWAWIWNTGFYHLLVGGFVWVLVGIFRTETIHLFTSLHIVNRHPWRRFPVFSSLLPLTSFRNRLEYETYFHWSRPDEKGCNSI
jgi:hypothetical protein